MLKFKKKKSTADENNIFKRKILNSNSNFETNEAYKAARTNIMFSLANEKECKKIIITSPTPNEGKTTTCLNLAISFAQTGARVLVIDADLRKSRIHKYLDINHTFGLSNVIGGFDKLENCIKKVDAYGIDCITSGLIPPNPAELLLSPAMQAVIDEVSKYYDYVFIDTPPINVVTDSLLLANIVTGLILVARCGLTTHDMIKKALAALEFSEIKILGFILNDAKTIQYTGKYKYGKYGYKKHNYYYGANGYGKNVGEYIKKKQEDKEEDTKDE